MHLANQAALVVIGLRLNGLEVRFEVVKHARELVLFK